MALALPTYRLTFALACLAAIRPLVDQQGFLQAHQREFVFVFSPLLILGFIARALPRWSGRPLAPRYAAEVLTISHGALLLLSSFNLAAASALRVIPIVSLAAIVVFQAVSRPNRKIGYVALLISIHALAAALDVSSLRDMVSAVNVALCALVLLCCELSDRICFAQLAVVAERRGDVIRPFGGATTLAARRIAESITLVMWAIHMPNPLFPMVAAGLGACRLIALRPWLSFRNLGVITLCIGALWLQVGLWSLALGANLPGARIFAIHAWGVGGLGMLAVGIMTSMVRKELAVPFRNAGLSTIAYASILLAALCRLAAAIPTELSPELLVAAAGNWGTGFTCCGLFVLFFGQHGARAGEPVSATFDRNRGHGGAKSPYGPSAQNDIPFAQEKRPLMGDCSQRRRAGCEDCWVTATCQGDHGSSL